MRSVAATVLQHLNEEKISEIKIIFENYKIDKLLELLDQKSDVISINCRTGSGTLLQHILFDNNGRELVDYIFNRLQPTKILMASIQMTLLYVRNELEGRRVMFSTHKLDSSEGLEFSMEFSTALILKDNIGAMIKFAKEKDRKQLKHYGQAMLSEYFNKSYSDYFEGYIELFISASYLIRNEVTKGKKLEEHFGEDGLLKRNEARHIVNVLRRNGFDWVHGITNKMEFLLDTLKRETYNSFFSDSFTDADLLATVKVSLDNINQRDPFAQTRSR